MRVGLFDFQETALANLRARLTAARLLASTENPQAITFSAPTGAGKTIVMTALFENIFFGTPGFEPQADAVILWVSDSPELNEQTRLKIESKSDRIRVRQIVNIDTAFDAERLEGGHVYFVNTGKLGTEKLLTKPGDGRRYKIWQTFANTAKSIPDRFYLVIDEAHRGMARGTKAAEKAQTIMQKFLLGSPDDGLCKMPIVIGISATPGRFDELLRGTTHTTHRVHIGSDDVRKSGLLKDRTLIHYPKAPQQAEMTLVAEAANHWQTMYRRWAEYCEAEGEPPVRPILVIQVEDRTDKAITKTNLGMVLATVESAIGRRLREGEVAHNFNDSGDLDVDGRSVRHIDASRIEEDRNVGVVLFKMSLSTGWDCPRAEVMMSFRRAEDHTYIAQLLGRMVRTPLARRVESDAHLNDVHLFLPHYDKKAVDAVIQDLKNVEDVPPSEAGNARELVILMKRDGIDDIFESLDSLVTYRVDAVRKQSNLRRLMGLGRALTQDRIDETAQDLIRHQLIAKMASEVESLRTTGQFDKLAAQFTGIELETVTFNYGTAVSEEESGYSILSASADVDRQFQKAGLLFGNGLHMDYWRSQGERDVDEVKIEVIVLAQDHLSMQNLEGFAEASFDKYYLDHKRDIGTLKEQRKKHYDRLRLSASKAQDIPWSLPGSIPFRRSTTAIEKDKHLFLERDGKFWVDLGPWEEAVLDIELKNPSVVGWLRNVPNQPWSLELPYRDGRDVKPMFPDLVIVRQDPRGFQFDILEPHDPSRKDNAAKAVGLAEFAEKHWDLFDRVQLIRKKRGADGKDHYFRLDVGNAAVRRRVLAVSDNNQLDQIFDEESQP